MFWGDRPQEPPKPQPPAPAPAPQPSATAAAAAAAPEPTTLVEESLRNGIAQAASSEAPAGTEQTSWSAEETSVPTQTANEVPSVVAEAEPVAEAAVESQDSAVPAPEETVSQDAAVATAQPLAGTAAPEEQVVPAAESAAPVAAPLTGGPPGLGAKPAQGRSMFSQRAIQRSRQDAPVVMPGGGSQLDKLGVQFGSLNFLGGADEVEDESA